MAAGAALALSVVVVVPGAARADETSAEQLFQEGLAAMKRHDYDVACEAFAGSNKADPSPGTQINLAVCFETQKKWASAWSWYRSAVGLAQQRGQPERERVAVDAAERLRPRLHYLVISVKEPLDELAVTRDGALVTIAVAGKEVPLPIDPGEHTIEVSARGKRPWKTVVRIADAAATDRVEVPKLEDVPVPQEGSGQERATLVEGGGSTQRTIGVLAGSAGLLTGLAAGGVYLLALKEADKGSTLRREAADPANASSAANLEASANSHRQAAESDQIIALVLGGGAVVLVGVGAYLYFTAPKPTEKSEPPKVAPVLAPGYAGVALGGAF